jgi:hypothetical protein
MVAGGPTGGTTLDLLAVAPRTDIFQETQGSNMCADSTTTAHLSNGSYWYFNGWSFGFSPNQTIRQCSADVLDAWGGDLVAGAKRMSWHTNGDGANRNINSGWRLGERTGLNGSTEYTRYVFQSAGAAAPTSLVVTNLQDDGSLGTLRWAINQANAQSGGIYDSIIIETQGTITLTSDLPAITQGLSITGSGMATTIIDGNDLYRAIYNNGQRTISISDMTLKKGKVTSGGLVWTNQGTFTVTNVKFSDTPHYAWYQQNQAVTTFDSCIFVGNYAGIRSDYGSTPTVKSLTDSDYQNRIYINDSEFTNNTFGLATERFVKIENSAFSGNTATAAQLQGLNRQQVYGSTFTNNGTAISLFSYIPTGWTPGAENQLLQGNTFNGNSSAVVFGNRFNNGAAESNGVSANSWSTSRNNTFDNNVSIYSGSGFIEDANTVVTTTTTTTTSTSTTTTTEVPIATIPPMVVVVPVEPEPMPIIPEEPTPAIVEMLPEEIEIPETEPETVVVIIPPDEVILPEEGEAISTGQLDNILEDSFTPNADAEEVGAVLDTLLGAELTDAQFDNVLEAVFTEDVSADVFTEALTTMLDAEITSEQLTAVLDLAFSEDTSAENMVSALESIFDGPISSGDLDTVMAAVFDEDISVEDTKTVLGDLLETNLSQAEAEAVFDSVFDGDLSDAETIDLIVDVLKDELTAELLGSVLGAVFDEEVSTEVLIETFTAVLGGELNAESVGVIVDVLESDTITSEQVSEVVTLVIEQEGGIPSEQATELATSAKVLESIDASQATEVFSAVVVDDVSSEQGEAIAEALIAAPSEVKESFEEEINVFDGVFDTYVALGSSIDVGDRRTLVAAGAAVAAVGAAASAAPSTGPTGPSGGSGAPSGGNSGGGGDVPAPDRKNAAKKQRRARQRARVK